MGILYTKKEKLAILGLLVLSLAVHFVWFGHPNTTVFDEVHFGKFISAYFTHEYYFDIHPPLGKLMLAGWGKLWGFRPGFSFANIGDAFPDRTYLALRFLPTLAGALLPLVIYGIARQLKMSHVGALVAGTLVALDNALLVQSRLILLDSFLLLFGFGAIWSYLRWRDSFPPVGYWLLVISGALGGMAMAIKWTGATFLGLIAIMEGLRLLKSRPAIRYWLFTIGCLACIPAFIYYLAFSFHFALLTKTGAGDGFMTPAFQHDLQGSVYASDTSYKSESSLGKFAELNTQMYESNKRLTATHPYSSKWYSWPFMQRPIFYWVKDHARIYLLGNPIVWWGSTFAILVVLVETLTLGRRRDGVMLILSGAWLMNLLPFIGIGRVMFLYHYFPALIWAILALAYVVDRSKHRNRIAFGVIGTALALFIFFAPLSYGLSMPDSFYDLHLWSASWR